MPYDIPKHVEVHNSKRSGNDVDLGNIRSLDGGEAVIRECRATDPGLRLRLHPGYEYSPLPERLR